MSAEQEPRSSVPPGYVSAYLLSSGLAARALSCVRCGALVLDVELHDTWHEGGS